MEIMWTTTMLNVCITDTCWELKSQSESGGLIIKMEKCKVIGCNNHVMEIKDEARAENMKGLYGYCQIHNIEGLMEEAKDSLLSPQEFGEL